MPPGADEKASDKSLLTLGKGPGKGQPSNDRKLLDNNRSTPAKHLRENCGLTDIHASNGQWGSLDFHPGKGVMRHPKAPADAIREDQVGGWDFHLCQTVRQYQVGLCGEPGLSPSPGNNERSLPLLAGMMSKEAYWRVRTFSTA